MRAAGVAKGFLRATGCDSTGTSWYVGCEHAKMSSTAGSAGMRFTTWGCNGFGLGPGLSSRGWQDSGLICALQMLEALHIGLAVGQVGLKLAGTRARHHA